MQSLEDLKDTLAFTLDADALLDLLELDLSDLVELLSDYIEENKKEIEERLKE